MIEYYLPGVDASQLSDNALALKIAHLYQIRIMEQEGTVSNVLQKFMVPQNL